MMVSFYVKARYASNCVGLYDLHNVKIVAAAPQQSKFQS